jgi:hypothetical protein
MTDADRLEARLVRDEQALVAQANSLRDAFARLAALE